MSGLGAGYVRQMPLESGLKSEYVRLHWEFWFVGMI
jgi:hypothetical protein